MTETIRILIIDDEKIIRDGCERSLSGLGYVVDKAVNGTKGVEKLKENNFHVVLLDLMMPGTDGFEVLKWIKSNCPKTQVIVITGFATVSKAVSAMKEGAFDFVGKPFTPDYIRIVVERALEKQALEAEASELRAEKAHGLETIIAEQSRIKTVFSCMIEAVLVTNIDSVVVLHNPAAVQILELQSDPIIGKPISASISDSDCIEMINESMKNVSIVTREFLPGTISKLYLRAHCAPVQTKDKRILGTVTVFEDITAIKKIGEMKSEFVAMVAHELRAPLASIAQMIYASHASCDYNKESQKCSSLHNRMTIRINELLQLIENLLNLSKLETGTIVFNLEPLNLNEIIEDVIEMIRPQSEKKKIDLTFKALKKDCLINADHDHIRNTFMNIIGNAIKYTPENGSVYVSINIKNNFVLIQVKDTGIGIEKENLPYIFDRFFRVKGAATRAITGSGLGLSVVKMVVEGHQGFINVASKTNNGTTFTLKFPLIS